MSLDLIAEALGASLTLRVLVAAFSAIALHELGHLVMGRLAGVSIARIVIGEGRRLFGWRTASVAVEIHAFPVAGYVEPRNQPATPLRSAMFAAGGIIANVITGALCLAAYQLSDPALSASKLLLAVALTHLGLAALNLIPRHFEDGNKSDGQLLLEAWRWSKASV